MAWILLGVVLIVIAPFAGLGGVELYYGGLTMGWVFIGAGLFTEYVDRQHGRGGWR